MNGVDYIESMPLTAHVCNWQGAAADFGFTLLSRSCSSPVHSATFLLRYQEPIIIQMVP